MEPYDNALPNSPEAAIHISLADFLTVLHTPGYTINMGSYHATNGACKVCLAGASMARVINDPSVEAVPQDLFNDVQTQRLRFIDSIARGTNTPDTAATRILHGLRSDFELDMIHSGFPNVEREHIVDFMHWIDRNHLPYDPTNPYPFIDYVTRAARWWANRPEQR